MTKRQIYCIRGSLNSCQRLHEFVTYKFRSIILRHKSHIFELKKLIIPILDHLSSSVRHHLQQCQSLLIAFWDLMTQLVIGNMSMTCQKKIKFEKSMKCHQHDQYVRSCLPTSKEKLICWTGYIRLELMIHTYGVNWRMTCKKPEILHNLTCFWAFGQLERNPQTKWCTLRSI